MQNSTPRYRAGCVKRILMLLAYPKNVQAELTDAQRRLLAKLVKEELQDG
jgi:hypothetical protein